MKSIDLSSGTVVSSFIRSATHVSQMFLAVQHLAQLFKTKRVGSLRPCDLRPAISSDDRVEATISCDTLCSGECPISFLLCFSFLQ